MKNYVKPGKNLNYTNTGSAITSGSVVVLTCGIAIACGDIAATTGTGQVSTEGVFQLAKEPSVAFVFGDRLYWDAGNSRLTKTAGSNVLAGFCAKAASTSDTVANVKLVQLGDSEPGNLAQAAVVAELNQISSVVDATDLQEVADKVDEIIGALKDAALMATA